MFLTLLGPCLTLGHYRNHPWAETILKMHSCSGESKKDKDSAFLRAGEFLWPRKLFSIMFLCMHVDVFEGGSTCTHLP